MTKIGAELFINPQAEVLNMDNIKTFEGFENISDEEAEFTVNEIHALCDIIYHLMTSETKLLIGKEDNDKNNTQKLAA